MSQNSEPPMAHTSSNTIVPQGAMDARSNILSYVEELTKPHSSPTSTPVSMTGNAEQNPFVGLSTGSAPSSSGPEFDQLVDGILNNPTPMDGGDAAAGKTTKAPKPAPLFGGDLHFHISPNEAAPPESVTTPNNGKESIF